MKNLLKSVMNYGIVLMLFTNCAFAQQNYRFQIKKIFYGNKVTIGGVEYPTGARFNSTGSIKWNDTIKCVIINDYLKKKELTISPYLQEELASRSLVQIAELTYKSIKDTCYVLCQGYNISLDYVTSPKSTYQLRIFKGASNQASKTIPLLPSKDKLELSFEMFGEYSGIVNCSLIEVTAEMDVIETTFTTLIL